MDPRRRQLRLLLVYAALALPAVSWGACRTLQSNHNSPLDWVPAEYPPRAEYAEFCRRFGPGDVVVMSWPGCTLDEARLDQLAKILRTAKVFYDAQNRWLFDSVVTGREAVAALSAPVTIEGISLQNSRAEAVARLGGGLVGRDQKTTVVCVTFKPEALPDRSRLVTKIRQAAVEFCGARQQELRLAGPVIDGLAVDEASGQALTRFALPSALALFVLCWLSLRSLQATLVVFGLSVFCQAATLAMIYFGGESMSALLIVLPPLVQVLAIAGGIHLSNYFFDAQATAVADPARQAFRMGWLPCVLSSGTTAMGMASLMASELSPIRSFGAYSAAGLLLTTGALLALLPALFSFAPPHRSVWLGNGPNRSSGHAPSAWHAFADFLGAHQAVITLSAIGLIVGGTWYAARLTTSVRIETLFAHDHRVLADYRWFEEHVGPMVPLEVVLKFDRGCGLSPSRRFALVQKLGERLERLDAIRGVFSAAACAPDTRELGELTDAQRAQVMDAALPAAASQFERMRLLHRQGSSEAWRLTARTSALGSVDYAALLSAIRADTQVELGQLAGVGVQVTGIMPLVHHIQGQLLQDLLASFVSALAMITGVMTLAQAGFFAGLIAMLPNVFPLAVFFGWLGWRETPIDIGTVMTASIALGIAVDDTLHLLTFFRGGLAQGLDRQRAVRYALRHCGPAMAQTSLSCGLGLLVFAASDFLPTSRFATSIAMLLALALAGDLILMPALLLGPLGGFFAAEGAADRAEPHEGEGESVRWLESERANKRADRKTAA